MNRSDEAIDRVLGALRDVETPIGMERRIVERVEARAAARSRNPFAGWALAGLAVAAVLIGAIVVGQRTAPRVPVRVAGPASPPQTVRPPERGHPEIDAPRMAVVRPTHRLKQWGAEIAVAPVEVSMVAPPLPLTDQERMLVAVARRGEPEKLSVLVPNALSRQPADTLPVLDPEALARREAAAEARFRQAVEAENEVEQRDDPKKEKGETQ